jgi:hypothetical protein
MRHIEVHVIETESDAASAELSGLPIVPNFVTACADCGDDVGALEDFEPYCVVLDDVHHWYLCTYCAEPVTDPELDVDLYDALPLDDDDDDFVEIDD